MHHDSREQGRVLRPVDERADCQRKKTAENEKVSEKEWDHLHGFPPYAFQSRHISRHYTKYRKSMQFSLQNYDTRAR